MPVRVMPKQDAIEQSMRSCARIGFGGGLYLIRGKADEHHYWRLDYTFNGKRNTLSLGVFPVISPEKARQQADAQRALAKSGVDPSEFRKATKNQHMRSPDKCALHKFEILHPESFQAQAEAWMTYAGRDWSENTLDPTVGRLETYLYPVLGHKLMHEIGSRDVAEIVTAISLDGKNDTAQRVWEIGRRITEYAMVFELAESNPFEKAKSILPKHATKHFAAMTHPTKLADLLSKIYAYHGTFIVCCALKLLTMLQVRPGNLRMAKWCDFDLKNGWWLIPGDKMKDSRHEKPINTPHVVPLPVQAVDILWQLHHETGHGDHVFPGRRDPDGYVSENTLNKALRRMGYSTTDDITAHGFRAVARTLAKQELGIDKDLLELQLDHTVRGPDGKPYARAAMIRDRKKMMQEWADYLDGLRHGSIVYDDPLADFKPVTSMCQKPSFDAEEIDFIERHEIEKSKSRNRPTVPSRYSDWDELDPKGWENVISITRNQSDLFPQFATMR